MEDSILDYETWQGFPRPGIPSYLEFVAIYWERDQRTPLPDVQRVNGEVQAFVNHGRWIVECPNGLCTNALVVSSSAPLFICAECASKENGGAWYRVTFPSDRTAIEAMLVKRPAANPVRAVNRNWYPDETVTDLRAQNREHGVPV